MLNTRPTATVAVTFGRNRMSRYTACRAQPVALEQDGHEERQGQDEHHVDQPVERRVGEGLQKPLVVKELDVVPKADGLHRLQAVPFLEGEEERPCERKRAEYEKEEIEGGDEEIGMPHRPRAFQRSAGGHSAVVPAPTCRIGGRGADLLPQHLSHVLDCLVHCLGVRDELLQLVRYDGVRLGVRRGHPHVARNIPQAQALHLLE